MKNEPADTESGSSGSITMPLFLRRWRTASLTSSSGAVSPTSIPRACASSPYAIGREWGFRSSSNSTARTTQRPGVRLKTLER